MTNCIICGRPKGYEVDDNLFCKYCYYKHIKPIRQNFDHKKFPRQLYEHYVNLKYSKASDKEEFIDTIGKMFALSQELEFEHGDNALSLCVKQDITNIANTFYKYQVKRNNSNYLFHDKDYRARFPRDYQCNDGHYVRSQAEQQIDDWLYANKIQHAYELMIVPKTSPNEQLMPDFYLKEYNVYIEYWGIEDNPSYANRKEKKLKLYDDNNIDIINLNKDDIKRLNDIMTMELSNLIKNKEQRRTEQKSNSNNNEELW